MHCGGEDAYKAHLDGHDIVLEGKHSRPACGEADDYFSLLPQDEYFFAVFSALWKELGGTLQGKLRAGTAPADQAPFRQISLAAIVGSDTRHQQVQQQHHGAATVPDAGDGPAYGAGRAGCRCAGCGARPWPLTAKTIMTMLQGCRRWVKHPLMPDSRPAGISPVLMLPVAMPVSGGVLQPANIARSTAAMRQWLNNQQLQFPELVLENGAGLSRKERISAQHLAELLQRATNSPFNAELEASLPILGMDGTVKKRFKDNEIAGYAHLKTGSLEGVKSIAGYVKAHSGKQWIVVFIVNHPNAALAQPAQDALIEWLQKEY